MVMSHTKVRRKVSVNIKDRRMVWGYIDRKRTVLDPPKEKNGIPPHFKCCLLHGKATMLTF
jgi:hypothetical protein